MRPAKCIDVMSRRQKFLTNKLAEWVGEKTANYHRINAEIKAIDWSLRLMSYELGYRQNAIESGRWTGPSDEYISEVLDSAHVERVAAI